MLHPRWWSGHLSQSLGRFGEGADECRATVENGKHIEAEPGRLQGTHAETLIDASTRTCLPATHWEHASSPVTSLNFPAGHLTHGPPAGPVCPRLQTQSASTLLPATATEPAGQCMHAELFLAATMVEYFPLSHSVQAAAPDDTLNLPAVQAKHIPPSGPV